MRESDRQKFAAAIGALMEAMGVTSSSVMIEGYWIGLKDLSIEAVEAAVAKALRSCKFMPKPVELRELSGEDSYKDRALKAWSVVEQSTNRIGSYRSVDFDDGITNAAIRSLGGWPAILDKKPEDFDVWVRKDFLAAYESFARSGVNGEMLAPLEGLSRVGDVIHIDGNVTRRIPAPVRISTGLSLLPHIEKIRPKLPSLNRAISEGDVPAITFQSVEE